MFSSEPVFISSVQSIKAAHSFLTFLCLSSQGGTSKDARHHCILLFLFPLLHIFPHLCCLLNVDIFKRATLSETVSRRGTSSTQARLSRGKVIASYASSPDVLLTTIDFHLFIFTLRIWSPHLSFNLKTATVPQ